MSKLKPYTRAEVEKGLDDGTPIDASSSWERVLLTIEAKERAEAACARKFEAMRSGMTAVMGHYECLNTLEKAFFAADPLWDTDNPGKGYMSPETAREVADAAKMLRAQTKEGTDFSDVLDFMINAMTREQP